MSTTTAGRWESTVSAAEMAAIWRGAANGRAVVVTHAKPDGDAVGSTLAVARTLERLGAAAEVWYVGPVPRWVAAMVQGTAVRELAPSGGPGGGAAAVDGRAWPPAGEPELIAVVDTGSWPQLAELRGYLEPRASRTVLVDHHAHGAPEVAERRVVDVGCASCTEALAPVCAAALGLESVDALPSNIAEPLYLGLATDTGWFRHSSVTPATLRLAGDLLEAGVDHPRLYQLIEQQDTVSRWKLLGRGLAGVRTYPLRSGGLASVMRLTLGDFDATGADRNDTGGFADMVLTVAEVRVSFVLTEQEVGAGEPPVTKVSARSKPGENAIDVNAAMQKLGGGGHARAAGAKVRAGLDEAERMALEAVR